MIICKWRDPPDDHLPDSNNNKKNKNKRSDGGAHRVTTPGVMGGEEGKGDGGERGEREERGERGERGEKEEEIVADEWTKQRMYKSSLRT